MQRALRVAGYQTTSSFGVDGRTFTVLMIRTKLQSSLFSD